ncbi:DUF1275 domain-containing protein [Granulicella sp. WH15]|uniref:YoaK family protein n=1 Tax=Granulicella sp. WH15 TaxID=2602070 RepID=UPI001366CEAC|nr:YoaK family protein [Granulicella sp. WH15]QHN02406.1 DUF1275 domain-containing protein [Granulicella sp. WH15]
MPLFYLRRLTGTHRTEIANRHLARYLAFVAGAANAGGFLAVRQYTSHMSGIVSAMADNLAAGDLEPVFTGLAAVFSFLMGAFLTTLLIRWARSRSLESEYALPLVLEALLLVLFGFTGRVFAGGRVLGTVMLLCLTMGLQNAIITKLSNAVIRTTHLTGMVTDIGIALGRLAFRAVAQHESSPPPELTTLQLHLSLIAMFFVGGVTGATGFKYAGFFFTLPLAVVLLVLAAMPVIDDLRRPVVTQQAKS